MSYSQKMKRLDRVGGAVYEPAAMQTMYNEKSIITWYTAPWDSWTPRGYFGAFYILWSIVIGFINLFAWLGGMRLNAITFITLISIEFGVTCILAITLGIMSKKIHRNIRALLRGQAPYYSTDAEANRDPSSLTSIHWDTVQNNLRSRYNIAADAVILNAGFFWTFAQVLMLIILNHGITSTDGTRHVYLNTSGLNARDLDTLLVHTYNAPQATSAPGQLLNMILVIGILKALLVFSLSHFGAYLLERNHKMEKLGAARDKAIREAQQSGGDPDHLREEDRQYTAEPRYFA